MERIIIFENNFNEMSEPGLLQGDLLSHTTPSILYQKRNQNRTLLNKLIKIRGRTPLPG